ncbi:bifunctional non-homologous end joining protein LigD [Lipingzhangella halophila]|uniref:Bifunctional non-homologous end joining protein LigD n=1 Tax=Lipingzhangella halophila TaxID=1783352 RepID=A0A7W7RFF7_9ACTN|nr:non-homologous end-joining DNA ligase [Lipingzhangella halophila]MBB4930981.1 bifunctional non-homologous end joining protein LigD [Lipingzhangella halophila]
MGTTTRDQRTGEHTRGRSEPSNPGKELFGAGGVTKGELAEHYQRVAPAILPHIRQRPLALHRFPDGIDPESGTEGFFQKQRPDHAPDWVRGVRVERRQGGAITMVRCDDASTLGWLADQAVITLHPWPSRAADLDRPDRVIFDLDPPDDNFAEVRWAALAVREVLDEIRLASYVMTTGSRGLHVVVPIRVELDFDGVRELARNVADRTAERYPERLTTEVRKEKRGGRLFVDILRNAYGQHAVAPFAVRPLPGAPVAMPVRWEELERIRSAQAWSVRDLGGRPDDDPWRGMARHARSPGKAARRLERVTR